MGNENRMTNDSASPLEERKALASADTQHAKDNINQFSLMLESEENTGVYTEERAEKPKPSGVKTMIAATAAASVMGITSMMHPEKAGEVTPPPIEPAPVEQVVEAPTPAFNLEQEMAGEEQEASMEMQEQTQVDERHKRPKIHVEIERKPLTWWHDVPAISQQELVYNGQKNDYGCAPTAVSMVTEYWHQQDPSNEARSAQELLDANVAQGEFVGREMNVTDIHDELSALGYEFENYANTDLETLKRNVAQGPVIAAVKSGMSTDGTPHSVVVTGISENNEVRINDPWNGESRTYSWETFSRSWGSAFNDVSSRNHFTVIRPS